MLNVSNIEFKNIDNFVNGYYKKSNEILLILLLFKGQIVIYLPAQ